jgi:hypothetical protein
MPALLRGAAPLALLGGVAARRGAPRTPCAPPRAMQTAQLGASELHVSRMGLGTMTFGARAPCTFWRQTSCSVHPDVRLSEQRPHLYAGERNTYDEAAHLLSMAGTCFSRVAASRVVQLHTRCQANQLLV